jgi:hypothetical protein
MDQSLSLNSDADIADLIDITPPKPKRKGNPLLVKGYVLNPNGRNGNVNKEENKIKWQDPASRARYLLEKYTPHQIFKFANSKIKHTPLSTPDYQLVRQIARTFEDGAELERFQNRTFGKVADKSINLNINLDATPEQLSERALELLSRITPDDEE